MVGCKVVEEFTTFCWNAHKNDISMRWSISLTLSSLTCGWKWIVKSLCLFYFLSAVMYKYHQSKSIKILLIGISYSKYMYIFRQATKNYNLEMHLSIRYRFYGLWSVLSIEPFHQDIVIIKGSISNIRKSVIYSFHG